MVTGIPKRAAIAVSIAFTELDNGFAATDDPAGLQRICDTLTSGTIRVFCERWWAQLPLPLTEAGRAAGCWWDISMRQVGVSRTIVFDAPRAAHGFFEALCIDKSRHWPARRDADHLRSGARCARRGLPHPVVTPRRRGDP